MNAEGSKEGKTPGGSRKCGKQRTYGSGFLDVWQTKGLRTKSWKCGKETTYEILWKDQGRARG